MNWCALLAIGTAVIIGLCAPAGAGNRTDQRVQSGNVLFAGLVAMQDNNRLEIYRRRFREARADPGLIRGRHLTNTTVNCKAMHVRDNENGFALTLGARTGNNAGYFTLFTDRDVTNGRADDLGSDDGYERIFVLSGAGRREQGVKVEHTLIEERLHYISDMIETLLNSCTAGRTQHIASFVLLKETEISHG